jgi:2-hydroxy-6-oxonona-2,4-dienedioate hydrolase
MLRFVLSCLLASAISVPHCLAQAQESDRFVTVYGAKIHYVEAGSGAPVILIHGLADNVKVWDSVIPLLAARFRVVAFDQIGFGRSEKPLLNYRVSTLVDFLDGFLTELKIQRASLVGNSLGGWVAAAFAAAHPERIERLVLSDAAGYSALAKTMDPRALAALRLASRNDLAYLGPLTFHDKRYYQDIDLAFKERVTAGDSYTIGQLIDSMIRGEDALDHSLQAIHRPTLILWGREDKLIPLGFGEQFHQEITGSQLLVIDNCGHMPQVESPREFATAVLRFLSAAK